MERSGYKPDGLDFLGATEKKILLLRVRGRNKRERLKRGA